MVGSAPLRGRERNPAKDETEEAAHAQQPVTGQTLPTHHLAHPQGGPGNGAPFGGAQGRGLPDLYQDAVARSPRGKRPLSDKGDLSARENPRFSTLVAVTKAVGLKLTIETARSASVANGIRSRGVR
jgi:hypothetical protein